MIQPICENCGKPFPIVRVTNANRFCSRACYLGRETDWTDETVARLRELWPLYSATIIAKKLDVKSKDAVIGKAHRLDLPAKAPPRPSKGA